MKKWMIVSLLTAILCFAAGVHPSSASSVTSNKQTTDDVIQALLKTKLVPTYSESEAVSATGETLVYKTWDNSMNGEYSSVEKVGSQSMYYASQGDKALAYTDGDSQAIEYNAGVTVSPNDSKPVIKGMQQTTTIKFLGKEKMLNREVYHLYGKGKTVTMNTQTRTGNQVWKHTYPDMELWVDTISGFIMKQKYGSTRLSYSTDTVVKVDFEPKFTSSIFTINLPNGVKVVNADDLLPK